MIKYWLIYRVLLPFIASRYDSNSPLNGEQQETLLSGIASWFPHTYVRRLLIIQNSWIYCIMMLFFHALIGSKWSDCLIRESRMMLIPACLFHCVALSLIGGKGSDCHWGIQNDADPCMPLPLFCSLIHSQ